MQKNVAGQKIALYAFDATTGLPKTGDAANLTAYVDKDWAGVNVLADTSATERDATNAKGWYLFDVAQAESNADALLFTGKSTTANIVVVGQLVQTVPAKFATVVIDAAGLVDANVVKVGPTGSGTAQTAGDLKATLTALFTTALTESYSADGAAPTVAQAVFLIMQRLTEFAISATTITVKKLDGSTTAATLTLDDATSPTSSTRAS